MLTYMMSANLKRKCGCECTLETEIWHLTQCSRIQQINPRHTAIGRKWTSRFKIKNGISLSWKDSSSGHLPQYLRADSLCQGGIFDRCFESVLKKLCRKQLYLPFLKVLPSAPHCNHHTWFLCITVFHKLLRTTADLSLSLSFCWTVWV